MPTWLGAVLARPRINLIVTTLVGMAIGLGLISYWSRASDQFTVNVLGSGNAVSVLITHHNRHVLFVSGNDGPEFSNAVQSRLAVFSSDIDLILIDESASPDVQDRARSLDSREVILLVSDKTENHLPVHIPFDNESSLYISWENGNWTALLDTPAGPIAISALLTGPAPFSAQPIVISLTGEIDPGSSAPEIIIGPTGNWSSSTHRAIQIVPGDALRIDMAGNSIRIPYTQNLDK